jgi:Tol biopolymer transport system component
MTRTTGALAAIGIVAAVAVSSTSAAPAHRNGLIVFQRFAGDQQQLFTMRGDGSGIRQLTTTGEHERPVWSPNGKRIAYLREPSGIFTINADGGGETELTAGFGAAGKLARDPGWSPDGRRIALEVTDLPHMDEGIWIMNANGSRPHAVTHVALRSDFSGPYEGRPRFSPDGKRLVFHEARSNDESAIFVVRVNGTGLRRITPWSGDYAEPSWSPDGSRVVFNSWFDAHPGQSANVFTARADGSGRRQLTHNAGGAGAAHTASYSPDGKKIVFTQAPMALSSHSPNDIYTMNVDGSHVRRLTHLAQFDAQGADWARAR